MKNHLTFLFILVSTLSWTKINAQSFKFGIHGTPALNYITTSDGDATNDVGLKFGFGLLAEYRLADKYSFATGVDIVNRGGDLSFRDTTGSYSAGYINIPLQLKMRTRQFGYLTYFATFGGGVSVKTSEEVSFDKDVVNTIDDYIAPVNLTFAIGGGVEYSLGGSTALMVALKYNRSLVDNLSDDNPFLNNNSSYRFDNVALSLGIIF